MNADIQQAQHKLASLLPQEQPRLLRLCTYLTGDAAAAEDLVQETFIVAWQRAHNVYDWEGYQPWLSAIARHVCQRWLRRQSLASQRFTLLDNETESLPTAEAETVEIELERRDLVELLDNALALLPPETRAVLLEQYVAESAYAETAVKLGISENLVGVRLHRGKLALRNLLTTHFSDKAAAYGLITAAPEWQETRIWCPFCGQRKLMARLDWTTGASTFNCPQCNEGYEQQVVFTEQSNLIADLKSPKAILSRQIALLDSYYRQALRHSTIHCQRCGQEVVVERQLPDSYLPYVTCLNGIYIHCPRCDRTNSAPLQHLALDLPITQRFWRAYPRMRVLPEQLVEAHGRPALITTFASVTHNAQLVITSAADTLDVLETHEVGMGVY